MKRDPKLMQQESIYRESFKMEDSSYSWPDAPRPTGYVPSKYHQEEAVAGIELNNYTKRVPSEDGTYVLVTTHTEKIEKIKQPLTPEERAEQRKQERIALSVVGTIVLGFLGVMGWVAYKDDQRLREEREVGDSPSTGA